MKKYPYTKQEGIKDCGAACLSMIIKYYKGYLNLEELRDLTKTTKEGTTAYHMVEAAKKIGFDCKGVECNLKDINKNNIILPAIAFVTIDKSYNHFIVIYEINYRRKYLIIADPKDKIKKISFKDFLNIFNNVLIILYPIKTIPINNKINNKYKFILKVLKDQKNLLKNLFILSILVTGFSIFHSFYLEYMLNGIYNTNSKKIILLIFIVFFSINLVRALSDYFRNKVLIYINQKIDLHLTLDTFKKIILLPYRYYKNRTTGEILSRINDLDIVREVISKVALSLFVDLPLTIISAIFLYFINPTLFFISIIILLSYILIIIIFKPIFDNHITNIQEQKAHSTSYMIESISGFESVKGIHKESIINDKFERKYVTYLNSLFNFHNSYFFQVFLKEIINNIGFLLIIFFGCLLVIDNKIELGTLLTFNSLVLYFLDPIRNIIDLDSSIKQAVNSVDRILELDIEHNDCGILDNIIKGDILIKNLDYSYDDRKAVLKKIDLNIKYGSKVIVLGSSGSGKSTLFKLLMKYYPVDMNKIYLDSVDINNYNLNAIKNNIIYISQNETLFTDTVYNNVVLNNNIDNKELIRLSRICFVDEVVNNNLGFNTLVEENGFNFSGGEKQRIILLRAILNSFNILIIDEGLNQVDISLERKILKNLIREFSNKTIIFISHRIDNIDLFDNVIEINNGVIVKELSKNG